jgi:cytochrome b561
LALLNSAAGYGTLTKAFHWLVAALFAFQLLSGPVMVRMEEGGAALGLTQDGWFNWHKTLGLVALALAVGRLVNRRMGELPPWAPGLSAFEQALIHRAEQALYLAMFAMPVSGFVFVMAGGFGVNLAGLWDVPRPIGESRWLAAVAQWVHVAFALLLSAALAAHLAVVIRHTLVRREGLIRRML